MVTTLVNIGIQTYTVSNLDIAALRGSDGFRPAGASNFVTSNFADTHDTVAAADPVAAAEQNADLSVDPCDDFYTYACGTWQQEHKLAPGQGMEVRSFNVVKKWLDSALRDILLAHYPSDRWMAKTQDLLKACTDTESLDAASSANLKLLLSVPGIKEAAFEGKVTAETIMAMNSVGVDSLIALDVMPSLDEPSKEMFSISPGGSYPIEVLQHFSAELAELLEQLLAAANEDLPELQMMVHPGVGMAVVKIVVDTLSAMERAMQAAAPQSEWTPVMLTSIPDMPTGPNSAVNFAEMCSSMINMGNQCVDMKINAPGFDAWIPAMGKSIAQVDPELMRMYVVSQMLFTTAPRMAQKYRTAMAKFEQALTGSAEPVPRPDFCVDFVLKKVGWPISREYVQKHFQGSRRVAGGKIVADTLKAFKESLIPQENWLDGKTAAEAVKKLESIKPKIGYPEWLINPSGFETSMKSHYGCHDQGMYIVENFTGMEVLTTTDDIDDNDAASHDDDAVVVARRRRLESSPSRPCADPSTWKDFFRASLMVANSAFNRRVGYLNVSRPDDSWSMFPITVNAYYTAVGGNQIVFPAAILQEPFVHEPSESDTSLGRGNDLGATVVATVALTMGGMGTVAGHETTHSLDYNGAMFDDRGRLRNWWAPQTMADFEKRAQCVVDEYQHLKPLGTQHIKGKQTENENIADNGGLRLARQVLVNSLGGEDKLNAKVSRAWTVEQLFYIGFAQVWCTSATNQAIAMQIRNDVHSPSMSRIRGTVQNDEHFAKAFNCPSGSRMAPEQRCRVW